MARGRTNNNNRTRRSTNNTIISTTSSASASSLSADSTAAAAAADATTALNNVLQASSDLSKQVVARRIVAETRKTYERTGRFIAKVFIEDLQIPGRYACFVN